MNALAPITAQIKPTEQLHRRAAKERNANVLPHIYDQSTNIVIWQRDLEQVLTNAVNTLISTNAIKPLELAVSPDDALDKLVTALKPDDNNRDETDALCKDIALLVEMFCCLFDLKRAGLRLKILDKPMCPRFHVDKIPCRLVTTYQGVATQWLNHSDVERSKLGTGNLGKPDEESGLFKSLNNINQLNQGDVALLKGEYWDENEGAGLVHRSPPVVTNEQRLLVTLDFI
ncbi:MULTISPECIES: DUF1826 domain-containing protein [unclassified Pseudoalteromonas]|jgi:hypothetical protein|uniref:DUF1826 domain-containing protein n=1 Tax=unclassified Pseudoalteromonas TaxID=194690 RepID=UPI0023590554|nr:MULTISPECIES: DUF1826 domain-containing protein [unclassified Pseudoalteromonas]MDC9501977.1 DUF1826 domain-containing protein [Pseudoalteromonas sp. Angola-18]MDC9530846.1 DUF1826 domain-containing protein [Pseudoalteromonas sp. Angola-7]